MYRVGLPKFQVNLQVDVRRLFALPAETPVSLPQASVADLVADQVQHEFAKLMRLRGPERDRARKSLIDSLQVYNAAVGGRQELAIAELESPFVCTPEIARRLPIIQTAIRRDILLNQYGHAQALAKEATELWGTSTRNDCELRHHFEGLAEKLSDAIAQFESGDADAAFDMQRRTLWGNDAYVEWLGRDLRRSGQLKKATAIGITAAAAMASTFIFGAVLAHFGANGAASLSGGAQLGLLTGNAASFVAAQRILEQKILHIPLARKDGIAANVIDLGLDVGHAALMMGSLRVVGDGVAVMLPVATTEPALIAVRNFAAELGGFNVVDIATSIDPRELFTVHHQLDQIAFLLGLRMANAALSAIPAAAKAVAVPELAPQRAPAAVPKLAPQPTPPEPAPIAAPKSKRVRAPKPAPESEAVPVQAPPSEPAPNVAAKPLGLALPPIMGVVAMNFLHVEVEGVRYRIERGEDVPQRKSEVEGIFARHGFRVRVILQRQKANQAVSPPDAWAKNVEFQAACAEVNELFDDLRITNLRVVFVDRRFAWVQEKLPNWDFGAPDVGLTVDGQMAKITPMPLASKPSIIGRLPAGPQIQLPVVSDWHGLIDLVCQSFGVEREMAIRILGEAIQFSYRIHVRFIKEEIMEVQVGYYNYTIRRSVFRRGSKPDQLVSEPSIVVYMEEAPQLPAQVNKRKSDYATSPMARRIPPRRTERQQTTGWRMATEARPIGVALATRNARVVARGIKKEERAPLRARPRPTVSYNPDAGKSVTLRHLVQAISFKMQVRSDDVMAVVRKALPLSLEHNLRLMTLSPQGAVFSFGGSRYRLGTDQMGYLRLKRLEGNAVMSLGELISEPPKPDSMQQHSNLRQRHTDLEIAEALKACKGDVEKAASQLGYIWQTVFGRIMNSSDTSPLAEYRGH